MIVIEAPVSLLAPLSLLLLPGLAWLPRWQTHPPFTLWALIAAASLASTTLATLIAALVGLPSLAVFILLSLGTGIALFTQRGQIRQITNWYQLLVPPVIFCLLLLLFAVPFFWWHDGLPTGDIQKSMIWANDILTTHHLPNYARSIADLNRDPVDFYTPGLHTLLAYVLTLSNSPTTAGLFAIVIALALAGTAVAIGQQLAGKQSGPTLVVAIGFLLLTNLRFLRYLREPGYHLQNSVGEFFLFGTIFLLILLLKRWAWEHAVLTGLTLAALAFTHQFSVFIAAFALLPFAIALAVNYYRLSRPGRGQPRSPVQVVIPFLAVAAVILLVFALGLHRKISDIFTAAPHLIDFTPTFTEYFSLLGPVWFGLGISGLVLLIIRSFRQPPQSLEVKAMLSSTIVMLALSQAPRFFIDIPPVRALFYIVVPLSITGALILTEWLKQWRSSALARLSSVLVLIIVLIAGASSVTRAYTLSHTLRTNSTLLPEQLYLIAHLQQQFQPGGVLIDDYNRRSASWLVLAGRPMFTRIAADLAQQMAEAKQSPLRYQLYLNQLDFEKIFSLGSHPAVIELMKKHNIAWVTGIDNSSAKAFSHNPSLTADASGGDIKLFKVAGANRKPCLSTTPNQNWLLRASTLVNDIGDNEDTFEHLPASLRSTRISQPLATGSCTYRTTDALFIPLQFNIGDYVAALWDQDGTGQPDIDVELVINFTQVPTAPLNLRTPTGTTYSVPLDGSPLRLPAREAAWDERGMVTLTLENTSGQPIHIDLIALGLAQVP